MMQIVASDFGNPAIFLQKTRGFASHPREWFAFSVLRAWGLLFTPVPTTYLSAPFILA